MISAKVRSIVLDALDAAPSETAVLLSGGVDSQLVFAALRELGKDPVAVSFRMEGTESRDWKLALATAEAHKAPFLDVQLPRDPAHLEDYVGFAVEVLGLRNKAGIECFWPRMIAMLRLKQVGYASFATGDGGDGYHVLSKKGMIHYRHSVEKMDEFRRWYFGREDWSQVKTIRRYAEALSLECWMPLADPRLLDAFLGTTWAEVNKPRQKEHLRAAFDLPKLPPHQNLQLGDSGIAEHFANVAEQLGHSGPVKWYNTVARLTAGVPESTPEGESEDRCQTSLW